MSSKHEDAPLVVASPAQRPLEAVETILDHAPVGIFWCTQEGELQDANACMADLTGDGSVADLISRVQNVGKDLFGGVLGDGAAVERATRPDGSCGAVWEFETPLRRRDHKQMFISVRMRAIRNEQHAITGYVGFCRDVTATREMAAALQATLVRNAQFTSLMAGLQQATTRERCCELACEAAMAVTASPRGLAGWLEREPEVQGLAQSASSGDAGSSGEAAPLAGAAQHDEAATRDGAGAGQEEALRLQAPTLKSHPWKGLSAQRLAPLWEEAVYAKQPVMSADPKQDPRLGADAAPLAQRCLVAPAMAHGVVEGVIILADAQGAYTEKDLDEILRIADVFGLALARIRDRESLTRAKQAAESANKTKSRLLANLSHEVRTPLAGISGLVEILLHGETASVLDGEHREALQVIRDSADHLRTLLTDMLDFSRLEADKVCLERRPFRLRRMVQTVAGNMRVLAKQKGLSLEVHVDEAVPEHVVGDVTRLTQVLTNCLGNAIKFTESGAVRLGVGVAKGKGASPTLTQLLFSIQDTGIGIPESLQDKIFDRFSQADETYARKYGGAGLGLSISRQLVRLMGGRIWVESELGAGSTFYFTVVLGVVDMATLASMGDAATAGSQQSQPDPSSSPTVAPLQILVAEDNPVNALVAKRFLAQLGHTTTIAKDGQAVMRLLAEQPFDAVFMDLEMPALDGLEATRRIREGQAGEAAKSIPIIALTAHALAEHRESCLAAGMDSYLTKPLELQEVQLLLGQIAGEREEAASPQSQPFATQSTGLPEASAVLNRHVIWERLGGDRALYDEMLAVFLEDAPGILQDLEAAGDARQLDEMGRLAHKLKSAAAAVGAETVRDVAIRLEHAAKEGRTAQATELTGRLMQSLLEVQETRRSAPG